MSRTLLMIAVGALLCCLGCAGDPEDPFFLYGRVQDGSGRPLPRAPITLSRGEGEICESRNFREARWPSRQDRRARVVDPVFEPVRQTEADDDGRFLFQLLRYELTPLGNKSRFLDSSFCYRVDVAVGKDGAKTSAWTSMHYRDVYLRRVYLWDEGAISLEPTVDGHLLSLPAGPLPSSDNLQLFFEDIVAYEWELTASGKPLWRAEQTASPFLVDGPIREDFAEVEARGLMLSFLAPPDFARPNPELEGFLDAEGTYAEHAASPAVILPSVDGRVPVSRGAPCSIGGTRYSPCPATDGKLDLVGFEVPLVLRPEDEANGALVVELPAPVRPSLAILRDVPSNSIKLEGSADGVTWSTLASVEFLNRGMGRIGSYEWQREEMDAGRFIRMELSPPPQPITRIRAPNVFTLRELSLFE